jgi:hypothetical protein
MDNDTPDDEYDDDNDDELEPPLISARGARPISGRLQHDVQGMLAAVGANGELYTPRRSGRFDPQSTLTALGAAAAAAAAASFAGHSPAQTPRSSWPDGPTPRASQRSPLPSGGGGLADRSALDRSSWLPSPRQSFGILRALSAEGSVDCSIMSKQAQALPHSSLSFSPLYSSFTLAFFQ